MPNVETNDLSERELDILKLVATGASNKEIAQKLFISSNTVKVHLRNIFNKIGVTSRTEAAMYAVRSGLTETASPQLKVQSDDLELQVNPTAALPQTHSLSDIIKNKLYIRYFGLFGILIILLITSILYVRRNNIQAVTAIPPTSTPRVQWFELPGLPTPRRGLAVANYENQIYAIGGETTEGISNIVESYDPQTDIWNGHSSKPTAVTDIHAAVIGGLIYIPGGRLTSGIPTNITEIYDPQSNEWSTGSPLPNPLSAYALTVFEGRIYIFGGWNGSQVVNNAYVYDPHSKLWSELPPMPTARSFAGAVAVGGKIYVIGGWNGNQALTVNEVYLPDLSGGGSRWVQASRLPSGRYGMGIANLADIIFIIGGKGSDEKLTVIALSPEEPNWGQIEAPLQSGWSFLGAVTVGTRLYLLGGSTDEGLSNQIWSYQVIFTITLPIIH
jgi:DNA-binding CsgD family transcriptional regulator